MEHNGDKIIQISTAPANLYNRIIDYEADGVIYSPIVCIGLSQDGDIYFCDTDSAGLINPIESGDIYEWTGSDHKPYSLFRRN